MSSSQTDHIRYTKRWFSYFDLLGFKKLVLEKGIESIIPLYQNALSHLEGSPDEKRRMGISISWFSDTFIIFTRGGRAEDFSCIESTSRIFFQHLILNQIPVRGALSYGNLYSQQEKNIFVGPALIDAYCYGEGQDWLGFVITPSAQEQMEKLSIPVQERFAYRQVKDSKMLKPSIEGPVYGFAFNNGLVSGKNMYLDSIKAMKHRAGSDYAAKYERTLRFISNFA